MALSAIKQGLSIFGDVDDTPVDGATKKGVSSNWAYDHDADLDAHTRNAWEIQRTGEYLAFLQNTSNDRKEALVADKLYALPFVVARSMTFDRIAMEVTTLVDPSNIRMGIYNNGTNLYPGTLKLDAGTVSSATTGIKAITINHQLTKGLYWIVCVSDDVPTVMAYDKTLFPIGLKLTDFTYDRAGWYADHTYGALPDPYPAGADIDYFGASARAPIIALRLASWD